MPNAPKATPAPPLAKNLRRLPFILTPSAEHAPTRHDSLVCAAGSRCKHQTLTAGTSPPKPIPEKNRSSCTYLPNSEQMTTHRRRMPRRFSHEATAPRATSSSMETRACQRRVGNHLELARPNALTPSQTGRGNRRWPGGRNQLRRRGRPTTPDSSVEQPTARSPAAPRRRCRPCCPHPNPNRRERASPTG